ncbi:hypothetical protein B0H15DRAFT_958548 [Mycena belliarum]|uniref:Uncharacterized protein n=1 Tax=Mycena belliarum TaxID=1033014 RepID=A0AAD6XHG8_9AGAR|nr:hypothetical protein B0H15DRAFT_958548 [Mycena belliae]
MNDPGGAPEWRGRVLWWLCHVERRAAEAIDAPAPPPAERRSPEPFPELSPLRDVSPSPPPRLSPLKRRCDDGGRTSSPPASTRRRFHSDALAQALLFLEAADFKARAALARLRPLLDAAYPALAHPLLLRGAAYPEARAVLALLRLILDAAYPALAHLPPASPKTKASLPQDGVDPVKAFLPLEHGFLQLDKHKLVLGTLELECGTPMEQFVQAEGGGYWEDLGWSVNVTIGEGKQMGRQLTLPPGFILSLFLSGDQVTTTTSSSAVFLSDDKVRSFTFDVVSSSKSFKTRS